MFFFVVLFFFGMLGGKTRISCHLNNLPVSELGEGCVSAVTFQLEQTSDFLLLVTFTGTK